MATDFGPIDSHPLWSGIRRQAKYPPDYRDRMRLAAGMALEESAKQLWADLWAKVESVDRLVAAARAESRREVRSLRSKVRHRDAKIARLENLLSWRKPRV